MRQLSPILICLIGTCIAGQVDCNISFQTQFNRDPVALNGNDRRIVYCCFKNTTGHDISILKPNKFAAAESFSLEFTPQKGAKIIISPKPRKKDQEPEDYDYIFIPEKKLVLWRLI